MLPLKEEKNYCAFIDVLGYGNVVSSTIFNTRTKIKILEDIYSNLFSSISQSVKQINYGNDNSLFIKSFSDSIYLESKEPFPLLFAMYKIFHITLAYYINFAREEKYTPLLRGGVVHDWTLRFMDIGSLTRQDINNIYKNNEFNNVVGLGVARAYFISEKSNLSGMRILLSPEVFNNISLTQYNSVPFECYYVICPNYLKWLNLPKDQEEIKLFFIPIRKNEKDEQINLYELCWPVFKYPFKEDNSNIDSIIETLLKIESTFSEENIRHLRKTAEVIYKSFLITISLHKDEFTPEFVANALKELKRISEE